jgi:undecaprenyl-diphosphatase
MISAVNQRGAVRHLFTWLGGHELGLMIAVAALLSGIWLFALLADEVFEGDTATIDHKILLAMRTPGNPGDPIGPPVVEEAARDITALGGVTVLGFLTLAVGGFLILDGKARMALFLWGAVVTGVIAGSAMKYFFQRPRPDLVPHAMYTVSTSFPSGHSMMSAVTYLTLGALLARSESRKRLKAYFMFVAMCLTFAVGVTRVYLGVHWPTDVLGGWTAGAVWALLCWLVARRLQSTHAIEQENEHTPYNSNSDD